MSTPTPTPATLSVLRKLAETGDPIKVAASAGWRVEAVERTAEQYGWPDIAALRASVRRYESKPMPAPPTKIAPPRPTPVPSPPPPAAVKDSIAGLLTDAREYGGRIEKKAEKIELLVGELRQAIEKEGEKDKARAEVERLERQLREAKAKLAGRKVTTDRRGSAGASNMQRLHAEQKEFLSRHGVEFRDVREWAEANDLPTIKGSLLPREIREAFDTAHPGAGAA